jgi:hypothetical protein
MLVMLISASPLYHGYNKKVNCTKVAVFLKALTTKKNYYRTKLSLYNYMSLHIHINYNLKLFDSLRRQQQIILVLSS